MPAWWLALRQLTAENFHTGGAGGRQHPGLEQGHHGRAARRSAERLAPSGTNPTLPPGCDVGRPAWAGTGAVAPAVVVDTTTD